MTVQQCPVCDSYQLTRFLRRSEVPVHQNLVVSSRDAARSVKRGGLDMLACENCGFIFNGIFDPSKLAYGRDYDNTQTCSAYFDTYLDDLIKDLVEQKGVRDNTVVEVGCGKGQFLRKLLGYPGANNTGFGFDPSYVGPDTDLDGRLTFHRCYFDDTCTYIDADVVVCRHVIEHVQKPRALLNSVRAALVDSPKARVFFETPCVEWILRHRVLWDFFYEHCSLFSAASMSLAFQRTGFSVERVEHIFGGQYLWLEARIADEPLSVKATRPETTRLARAYGADEAMLQEKWLSGLIELKTKGKVALWGAGAKGVTFANLVDPDCALIDCVIDLNPNKQGCYIPGTGHPIVALVDVQRRGIKSAVLMNPNYREENLQLLADAHIKVDLIDWSHQ